MTNSITLDTNIESKEIRLGYREDLGVSSIISTNENGDPTGEYTNHQDYVWWPRISSYKVTNSFDEVMVRSNTWPRGVILIDDGWSYKEPWYKPFLPPLVPSVGVVIVILCVTLFLKASFQKKVTIKDWLITSLLFCLITYGLFLTLKD